VIALGAWHKQRMDCHLTCRPAFSAPDPDEYEPIVYKTPVTNNTFSFNLAPMTQADAEAHCQRQGAHLAAFISAAEQADVERAYMDRGWLFPDFHVNWFIGLNKNSSGHWVWTDGMVTGAAQAAML
jgi:hypothetical protein